jgi:hypothetical protein
MAKAQKTAPKTRINLYLDKVLGNWITEEAEKLGLNESAFARMLLINAYNTQTQEK